MRKRVLGFFLDGFFLLLRVRSIGFQCASFVSGSEKNGAEALSRAVVDGQLLGAGERAVANGAVEGGEQTRRRRRSSSSSSSFGRSIRCILCRVFLLRLIFFFTPMVIRLFTGITHILYKIMITLLDIPSSDTEAASASIPVSSSLASRSASSSPASIFFLHVTLTFDAHSLLIFLVQLLQGSCSLISTTHTYRDTLPNP